MRLRFALCAGAIAGGLFTFSATASPVGPGQTITQTSVAAVPAGQPIAQITRTVDVTYTSLQQGFEPTTLTESFVNEVFRDPISKRLTFVFRPGGIEQDFGFEENSKATYGNFDGFTTDVDASATQFGGLPNQISRDLIGNVTVAGPFPGQGETRAPTLVIATNATDFDRNGSVQLQVMDELNLKEINSNFHSLEVASADFTLNGLFQPKESGSVAVPLPPAAFGGFAMLALIVAPRLLRKRFPA